MDCERTVNQCLFFPSWFPCHLPQFYYICLCFLGRNIFNSSMAAEMEKSCPKSTDPKATAHRLTSLLHKMQLDNTSANFYHYSQESAKVNHLFCYYILGCRVFVAEIIVSSVRYVSIASLPPAVLNIENIRKSVGKVFSHHQVTPSPELFLVLTSGVSLKYLNIYYFTTFYFFKIYFLLFLLELVQYIYKNNAYWSNYIGLCL